MHVYEEECGLRGKMKWKILPREMWLKDVKCVKRRGFENA